MKIPQFDKDGCDRHTFAPFVLRSALDTEWKDVRLEFSDWEWRETTYGTDTINGYYLNGYGVEGLVKAVLFASGIDPELPGIDYNSEGSTCYIHFEDLDLAVRVAQLAAQMITDPHMLRDAIGIAREYEFDDG